jgi:hypothetical protein
MSFIRTLVLGWGRVTFSPLLECIPIITHGNHPEPRNPIILCYSTMQTHNFYFKNTDFCQYKYTVVYCFMLLCLICYLNHP